MRNVVCLAAFVAPLYVLSGCSSCRNDTSANDAGPDVGAVTTHAAVVDAANVEVDAAMVPSAPSAPAHASGGGPFQGSYLCGSLWGMMQVHQNGESVSEAHSEAGGTVLVSSQCTVSGTKCVGTYSAKEKKTGKSRGRGSVTIYHYPDKIGYQADQQGTAFCKRQ